MKTNLRDQFLLDPGITFLNHGSFGATPRPVFEAYQAWQRELERQPVAFLGRRYHDLLAGARRSLAATIGAEADNLVFVPNATTGLNIIAHSLALHAGDAVVSSDLEYGAADRMWRFLSAKNGFAYHNQPTRLPLTTAEDFVDTFFEGVSPATRVIFLSHITSATALCLPVKEICRRADELGILTVIDGAHAPGQIPLNLVDLGADFYTGNCHKWMCAPKGSAFLYARPAVQALVEPLMVSWGWEPEAPGPSRFIDLLEWTGTRDPSAYLSVPAAIRFQEEHDWDTVRADCHAMAAETLRRLTDLTHVAPLSPITAEWIGQMAAAQIPSDLPPERVQAILRERFRIEIPLNLWNDRLLMRFSYQAYNRWEDVDCLLEAVTEILGQSGQPT
jgi:isopenicillin-N epimerase